MIKFSLTILLGLFLSLTLLAQNDALPRKIQILTNEKKFEEAIVEIQSALQQNPFDETLYFSWIRIYESFGQKKPAKAERDLVIVLLANALESSPQNARLYLARAELNNSLFNDRTQILNDVNKAFEIGGFDEKILLNAISILNKLMEFQRSLDLADRLVSLNSTSFQAYLIRSEIKFKLTDYVGAVEDKLMFIELLPAKYSFTYENFFPKIEQKLLPDEEYLSLCEKLAAVFKQRYEKMLKNPLQPRENLTEQEFQDISNRFNYLKKWIFYSYLNYHLKVLRSYEKIGDIIKVDEQIEVFPLGYFEENKFFIPNDFYFLRANYLIRRDRYLEALQNLFKYRSKNRFESMKLLILRGDLFMKLQYFEAAYFEYQIGLSSPEISALAASRMAQAKQMMR